MPLALEREDLVIYIDTRVTKILSTDGDFSELFMVLGEMAGELSKLINCTSKHEMDMYCEQYEGFHIFMNFFLNLSSELSKRMNSVPTYH